MKILTEVLSDYQEYHTKKITQTTHLIGVPLIVFGIMMFFSWFSFNFNPYVSIPFMWVAIVIASIYYLRLDLGLGFMLSLIFILMGIIIFAIDKYSYTHLSGSVFLVTFVGGWIIQFIGHIFESRKPAFLDNILQVFAAPVFVLAETLVRLGYRSDLASIINKNKFTKETNGNNYNR